ncbi:MAG: SDR family NAD(P)-dependent oxidoreductase [Proteobacteria bacterium]|jgi:NAD(P)-dependent dehydrogenase (short-subunit alcohol dehydrogenase family)|nr:SDR family oxidoreductase [Candidatus Puniceispirillum sp.]MDA0801387.1 SDR family NAD(P)-dependent oxidoreductase [Pseudomonadota bacterium]MDA0884814.1 SDR family NAD(P)-dependent oxidoreductase [Pseudomonadota bacterium]MDA1150193.1 SDR family NAD(P)-dependent oxidoreductase [Pseudomonadota bacterium]MDP4785020.1 SDR family oxidoreductase [Alphaproteobacteria bacterium]
MTGKLHGKTIVVTGAARGLGALFCQAIADADGTILALGRDEAALAAMIADLSGTGHDLILADVAKADAVADGLVSRQFDGLVNNAGIAVTAALHASTEDDVRRVIDTNFLGSLWTLQAAVPVLKAAGGGVIVNIASVLGHRPLPHTGIYAASKAAIMQMTRSAAIELARDHIRVNALAPGYVMTDLNRDFLTSDAGIKLQKRTALHRFASPAELMPALLFLLDPANSYMTGETLTIDGGMSASL